MKNRKPMKNRKWTMNENSFIFKNWFKNNGVI
jgi:hypothetical protein